MYKFKVGDKGKTRGGKDYEVLYVEPEKSKLNCPVYAKVEGSKGLTLFTAEGQYYGHPSSKDLVPPAETVWIVLYRLVQSNKVWSISFPTAHEAAQDACKRTPHRNIQYLTTIKQEIEQ